MSHCEEMQIDPKPPRATDVLYFLDAAPNKIGGAELFALYLGRALEQRGLSVTIAFCAPPCDSVRRLFDSSMQIVQMDHQASFSLSAMREMATLLRHIRPKYVMYYLGGILRPLPWIARLCGAEQIIYSDHASRCPEDSNTNWAKRAIMRLITRPVTAVIAVSEFVAACNRAEKMHRAPIHVIPNAVDLSRGDRSASREHFLSQYQIPQERLIVSQLSSLIEEKGVDTLLHAAAIILQQRRDVHFVIGGEGAGRQGYEQMAKQLAISDHVTFIGKIDDPMLSGFYPSSDIFCLPSRWYEAWGLVLIEAMSFGVPVVATRVGGIPEFVRHGVDGFLAEGNPDAFASAIAMLLRDRDLRRRMGASARAWVGREFEISAIAERYIDVMTGKSSKCVKSATGSQR